MIRYEIEGGSLPVVICYPEEGQVLCTESGSMSWMSPNMLMSTNTGGGIKKVFSKMFSGERIFMNEYTPTGGAGMIAFASSFPGSIIPYEVHYGQGIIVQKGGFLAMEKGMDLSVFLTHAPALIHAVADVVRDLGGSFSAEHGWIPDTSHRIPECAYGHLPLIFYYSTTA